MTLASELSIQVDIVNVGTVQKPVNKRRIEPDVSRERALRFHEGVTDHLFDT